MKSCRPARELHWNWPSKAFRSGAGEAAGAAVAGVAVRLRVAAVAQFQALAERPDKLPGATAVPLRLSGEVVDAVRSAARGG